MEARPRRLFTFLVLILLTAVTAFLGEIFLRIFFQPVLGRPPLSAERTAEHLFWERSPSLGWSHVPNASGVFTNGCLRGEVHMDAEGNRKNSRAGTYVPGYRDLFFLGDSATASLEVNDDETVPAILERMLRTRGLRYNVINLGVRGYGTDQSVRKALELSRTHAPAAAIYLYVENDPFDNNVLREAGRKYGKGIYLRPEGSVDFLPYNYPVPLYADDFTGLAVLDGDCHPHVRTGSWKKPAPGSLDAPRRFLENHLYLVRGLGLIRRALEAPDVSTIDPDLMTREDGWAWSESFYFAYTDEGEARDRCRDYFDSQMRFLLGMLRRIPSLESVHVVHFPDAARVRAPKSRGTSPSTEAFRRMLKDRVVDDYLDLAGIMGQEGKDPSEFQCPCDEHFCGKGTAWIASRIAESISFHRGPP